MVLLASGRDDQQRSRRHYKTTNGRRRRGISIDNKWKIWMIYVGISVGSMIYSSNPLTNSMTLAREDQNSV